MKPRFWQYFTIESFFTLIALGILRLLHFLPYQKRIALGKRIGRLVYRFAKRRVNIARVNLRLCLPEKSESERETIVLKVFENFGAGIFETAMSWWTPYDSIYKMIDVEGEEVIEQALAKGKGVILLGAHFTVLDLSAVLVSKKYPVIASYRNQTNLLFNRMILKGRERALKEIIPHTNMLKTVKRIKQGNIVWYAPDQDMGEENSVFAPFFGHPAATLLTTAKLAKMTQAPIVMFSAFRKKDDSGYIIRFTKGPEDFPGHYPGPDEKENAAKINQVIENAIRYDITQYSWFHRRFKSQPDREKGSIYEN